MEKGRVMIGEGELTKMCRKGPKKKIFFLFNDILVYGGPSLIPNTYTRQHIMRLEDMEIEPLDDPGEGGELRKNFHTNTLKPR